MSFLAPLSLHAANTKETEFPEATELREDFLEESARLRRERVKTLLERNKDKNEARLQVEYSPLTVHLRFKSLADLSLDLVTVQLDGVKIIEGQLPVTSTLHNDLGWQSFYAPRVPVGQRFLSVRIEARKRPAFRPFFGRASRLIFESSIPVFVNPDQGQLKFVAALSDSSLIKEQPRLQLQQIRVEAPPQVATKGARR